MSEPNDADKTDAAKPSAETGADAPAPAAAKPAAARKAEPPAEPEKAPPPPPDPATCRGIAISQDRFENAVLEGEFAGSDFMFYLEPAGVLSAQLICTRCYPAENVRAGILMTRAAWQAKTIFFDDGINPEKYELSFPKEFGYIKSIQHYQPESREHAKYPWSKKY